MCQAGHIPGHMLGTGGNVGSVPFVHADGWTVYLTSANGASAIPHAEVFNVQEERWYGDEYDMDDGIAERLEALSDELITCNKRNVPTVVHCNHGRTRSVIAVGVHLMRYFGMSSDDALGIITASFSGADNPHYHAPGERVSRALMMYAQLRGYANTPLGADEGGARRSARIAGQNACTGNCG